MKPLGLAALAAGAASAITVAGRHLPPRIRQHVERTNFSGKPVTLMEGIAATAGVSVGAGVAMGAAGAAAHAVTGLVGLIDDVVEPLLYRGTERPPKGLRGHVAALRQGTLTTGNVKILGIVAASALAAAGADSTCTIPGASRFRSTPGRVASLANDTALIAGCANLINLFDLRPGRALKVSAAAHVLLLTRGGALTRRDRRDWERGQLACRAATGRGMNARNRLPALMLSSGALGTTIALLPRDLAGTAMLGDAGANALGLSIGTAAAGVFGMRTKLTLVIGVVALTLASEKISFSAVIDGNRVLRAIDAWGRTDV